MHQHASISGVDRNVGGAKPRLAGPEYSMIFSASGMENSNTFEGESTGDSDESLHRRLAAQARALLRSTQLGLVVLAAGVGVGSGLGAVGFRWLVFAVTWVATGHDQFGQQGRVGSLHLAWLGSWFVLFIPVVGGLLYGPLIARFAPEARGHGVPEVMIAVAEDGGRIRPQVTLVKALASALCIGVGGSVGREGPIVQIGSAFASSIGQWIKASEGKLRILVACGAAGAISATFNAPITGVFFGFEIILRELSGEALFSIIAASVVANLLSQLFFGSDPFFAGIPHNLVVPHSIDYLLVLLLGLLAGVIGVGFKSALYKIEDLCDSLWGDRPSWLRPVAGGVVLGGVLFALPEMYGVGYPVMDKVIAGHEVLWLVVILLVAKPLTASLTIGIGGSGGIFAPSLFTGAMAGAAFGIVAHHFLGSVAGPLPLYAVVAMGAVFASATQAPITAIASVTEMSGNFGLTVAVMLAVASAVGISRKLTYGTIYTTKLLRRGIDIDRPRPANLLQVLNVKDVMQPTGRTAIALDMSESNFGVLEVEQSLGTVVATYAPQAVVEDESLEQALRRLALYGPDGLPVLDRDRVHIVGWLTREDVIDAIADQLEIAETDALLGQDAAEWATRRDYGDSRPASGTLDRIDLVEIMVTEGSASDGRMPREIALPKGWSLAAVRPVDVRRTMSPAEDGELQPGDRLILLIPSAANAQ